MKKRKHRLVVEVTVTHPLTERHAASGLRNVLGALDLQRAPMWASDPQNYVEKLVVEEFWKVHRAGCRKAEDSGDDPTRNSAAIELGRAGGTARAKALSPSRRKEIARIAAIARWSK